MKYKIPTEFIDQTKEGISQKELDRFDRTIQKLFPPWELEKAEKASATITVTITVGKRYYAEANSKDPKTTDMMEARLRELIYLLGA